MQMNRSWRYFWAAALLFSASLCGSPVWADTLRVVTYNIQADTGGAVGSIGGPDAGPGLTTVLQAIGSESLAGDAQPIDVLALQELNGTPTTTLNFIVGQLNSIYGAGTYAYDTTTDPTDGNGLTGNGPSGLIYNTHTVKVVSAVSIGPVGSSGAARAPMRYELESVNSGPASDFYMYVSHMKSSTTSSDANRRNVEATEIRTNAATLGPNAHIIYAGDYNTTSSTEAAYKTMVASGVGQAIDTVNPANNWTASQSFMGLLTESATKVQFRDDYQMVSGPMLNQPGMQLVPGSYTAFGNNGSITLNSPINSAQNTALGDLSNRTTVLTALTTATDHLPIVADYQFVPAPEPASGTLLALASVVLVHQMRRRGHRAARHAGCN